MMSITFILIALLAAFFIGLSKGGFANFGMLVVPLLALEMPPIQAAGLTLPLFILSDIVAVWVYRHSFSARNLIILIPAGMLGTAAGWASATMISDVWMTLGVGLIGVIFCAYMVFKPDDTPARPADVPRGLFWGALAGLTSFVSHAGAPPYQVYTLPQKLSPVIFAGTTTLFFAAVNLFKVIPYIALGELNAASFSATLWLLPAALLGVFSGWQAARKLPVRLFFQIVQWALFVVSCKLIYDGVSHLLAA